VVGSNGRWFMVDPPLPRWRLLWIVMTNVLGVDPVTATIRGFVFLCRLGLTVCRSINAPATSVSAKRRMIFEDLESSAPKALGITSYSAARRPRHALPAEAKVRCHIQLDGSDLKWKIDERMECNSNQRNNDQRLE
jgi:hypothetical protein